MKKVFEKILEKFGKAENPPEAKAIAEALRRLSGNEDFQTFRTVVKCYFADCARGITVADSSAVDVIRGQMYAYDRIFELTGEKGIAEIEAESKELARTIGLAQNDDLIY
jgi:hypothetical protein